MRYVVRCHEFPVQVRFFIANGFYVLLDNQFNMDTCACPLALLQPMYPCWFACYCSRSKLTRLSRHLCIPLRIAVAA